MKRIFAFVLTFVICLTCLSVPASATEVSHSSALHFPWRYESELISSVLDFSAGANVLTMFDNFGGNGFYIVFNDINSIVSSISFAEDNGSSHNFSIYTLSGTVKTAYYNGWFDWGRASSLTFNCTKAGKIQLLDIKYSAYSADINLSPVSVSYNSMAHVSASIPLPNALTYRTISDVVNDIWYIDTGLNNNYDFYDTYFRITYSLWQNYEYISFFVTAGSARISSVTVFNQVGEAVPIETESVLSGDNNIVSVRFQPNYRFNNSASSGFYVLVQTEDWNGTDYTVGIGHFFGFLHSNNSAESFLGGILSTLRYYLRNIWASVQQVRDSILKLFQPDSSASDSAVDNLDNVGSDIDDIGNVLDSVTMPPVESIPSATDFVDFPVINQSTGIFTVILEDSYLLNIFLMAITLSLTGYIIYGKKD